MRVATRLVGDRPAMFADWCIADADLALALMRLLASGDPLPDALRAYAAGQWQRPSLRAFVERAAAAHR